MPLDCQLGIVAMWGKWEGFVKWLMECCRVEVSTELRLCFMEYGVYEISTQADGAQSSRVPRSRPLPEDPYEAIRKAYLDAMDTESEPFEDPIDTKTPESPLTIAPPTSLPEKVAAMSESAFRKRFRSSYESLPSFSPPDLLSQKHYRGTSELVEDSDEDDDKEDEEIEESLDSNSVSKDAEDEGPIVEDEDPTTGDEGLAVGDEGPDTNDESHGLDDEIRGLEDEGHSVESDGLGLEEEEEAVPGGQQQAAPIMGTAMSAPLGLRSAPESKRPKRVSASRQPTLTTWTDLEDDMVYIDVPAYPPPTLPIQTPPSPEWMSGSLPISPSPFIIPSPISSPMIPLTVPLPVATPTTAETDGAVRMQFLPDDTQFKIPRVREGVGCSDIGRDIETSVSPGFIGRYITGFAVNRLVGSERAHLELAEIKTNMRSGHEARGGARGELIDSMRGYRSVVNEYGLTMEKCRIQTVERLSL
ncbi:hypothetical protein Tco_0884995 [Tanacetum coccineum]